MNKPIYTTTVYCGETPQIPWYYNDTALYVIVETPIFEVCWDECEIVGTQYDVYPRG